MSFYSDMATIAHALLTQFGQAVSISRQTVGAYDPATGAASVATSTQSGKGAIFDYYGTREIDGTLIQMGDKKLLLSTNGISEPQLNDKVTVNSVVYTIVGPIKKLSPAGTDVLYICNVRN